MVLRESNKEELSISPALFDPSWYFCRNPGLFLCKIVEIQLFRPQIAMPHQVLPAPDLVGVAVGNDKEVVCNGGDGVVVVVGDNDAVVIGAFSNHGFNVLDVHGVNLGEGLVEDVEGGVAVQDQIQFGQPCLAAGEFIDGRIVMPGELWESVDKSPVVHAIQVKRPMQLHSFRNQSPLR